MLLRSLTLIKNSPEFHCFCHPLMFFWPHFFLKDYAFDSSVSRFCSLLICFLCLMQPMSWPFSNKHPFHIIRVLFIGPSLLNLFVLLVVWLVLFHHFPTQGKWKSPIFTFTRWFYPKQLTYTCQKSHSTNPLALKSASVYCLFTQVLVKGRKTLKLNCSIVYCLFAFC